MPSIDYEACWVSFKALIVEKPSHGARDLALEMARIEVENTVPQDQRGFDPAPSYDKPSTTRPRVVNGHG